MTKQTPHAASRFERVLAFMIAGVVGLAVLGFIAIIAGTAMGVTDWGTFIWRADYLLITYGLPLGFVLLIVLVISVAVRRSREAKRDRP